MELSGGVFLEQRITISMNQIQSLEILAMDSIELNEFLQNEYMDNPLLEYEKKYDELPGREMLTYQKQYGDLIQEDDNLIKDIPDIQRQGIEDYIMEQLDLHKYSNMEMSIIKYLIAMLDDTGYFTADLDSIAQLLKVDLKLLKRLISELRLLEPYGIFSRDLKHCLLRQLEAKGMKGGIPWKIVSSHLNDFMDGKIGNISRKMKLPTSNVRKAIEQISKLYPRPMISFLNNDLTYIRPDILLSWNKNEPEIFLNDNYIENYSISDYYLTMMKQTEDEDLLKYFRTKYERIKMIFNGIEQRRNTIRDIAREITGFQKEYLQCNAAMKPITMTELADRLGISVSTVSRAVKGKYIQTEKRLLSLRKLFSNKATADTNDSNNISSDEVKHIIMNIIDHENPKKPYSDSELAELLKDKKINVSRRVIAKYRNIMGIKSSFERKETAV